MPGPLSDLRVLDFGRYVAGPYCATLLGYLGADVIRVERPGGGEDRAIAPVTDDGTGAVFVQTGSNKRSVCLNLRADGAGEVRERLIRSADVVVTNFPPVAQKKLGFDLASLQAIREDVILANASAFGGDGPYATRGGFDGIGQAMSGAMAITGVPGAPAKAAAPYADYTTAVLLAFGVMAALRERDQHGYGQEVSGTLLGTALAAFNSHLIEQGVLGLDRVGTGNRVQTSAPSDVFETSDGHVLVHCPGDAIFARIATLLEREDWLDNPNFATDQQRGDARDELCAPLAIWCASRTTDEVLNTLADAGVPAGPVLTPGQTLAHPQVHATGVLNTIKVKGVDAPVAGLPFAMSASQTGIRTAPADVGQHTDAVLDELGYTAQEIATLRERGIVA